MNKKKCRACLSERNDDLLPLFSINNKLNNSLTNAELIMACSSVHITQNDGLPQNICNNCYDKLLQSYEFKLLCENSDKILHSVVKQEEADNEDDHEVYVEDNYNLSDDNVTENIKIEKNEPNTSDVYKKYATFCSKQIDSLNKLKSASTEVKPVRDNSELKINVVCSKCTKSFNNKEDLKKHFERIHQNAFPTLPTAPHQSTDKVKTEETKKSPAKKEPPITKCLICQGNFKNILAHYHQEHKVKKCPNCKQQFIKFNFFLRHMRSECGKRPPGSRPSLSSEKQKHLCSYCGHCFTDYSNLKAHLRIHTGEKPYSCEFCDRKFAQWSSIHYHRLTHTGEKRFACEICGKAFGTAYRLKNHTLTHSDEQKYSCEVCRKKFKNPSTVKAHMVVHTGLKDFKCEFCGKAFGFKKNLVVHRRTHTGEKPFVCEICSQRFTQRHCLRGHMRSQHKQQSPTPEVKDFNLINDFN